MTSLDHALTSIERLKGFLLDRQAGKVVPQILIDRELALLTERVMAMGTFAASELVVFDLNEYRKKAVLAGQFPSPWVGEADEQPLAADGVAEIEDGS